MITACVFTQSRRTTLYTTSDGLTQTNARALLQDRTGYIWVGTWDGLNRLDGLNIVQFPAQRNNEYSPASHSILRLYNDPNDNIWITFIDGRVNIYEKNTGKFVRLRFSDGNETNIEPNCGLQIDADGNFWFIQSGKFYSVNYKSYRIQPYSFDNIPAVRTGKQLSLFVLNKLFIFNKGGEIDTISFEGEIYSVLQCSQSQWLVAPEGKAIVEYNSISLEKRKIPFQLFASERKGRRIFKILEIENGGYYLCTSVGLYKYSQNTGSIAYAGNDIFPTTERYNPAGISVFDVLYDYSGVMWVGTANGLIKNVPVRRQFNTLLNKNQYNKIFNGAFIAGIAQLYGDRFLITSPSGVYIISANGRLISKKDTDVQGKIYSTYSAYSASDSNIYLGGIGCVYAYNKNGVFLKKIRFPDTAHATEGKVLSITERQGTDLFFGTSSGLVRLNRATGKMTVARYDTSFGNEGNSFILSTTYYKGYLWCGTNSEGLLKINPDNLSFERILHNENSSGTLPHNKVSALLPEGEGLWIGTMGGGLARYIIDEKKFINYSIQNGLPNNVILGILIGNDGNIWVSTNGGIAKVQVSDNSIASFSLKQGLPFAEFNQNSYLKTISTHLIFGGVEGIVSFIPENIKSSQYTPNIAISGVYLFNKLVPQLHLRDTIFLHYNQNFVSLGVSLLLFDNPKENRYGYKLEGYNRDWVYPDAVGRIELSNLLPGEYKLFVKTANEDNVWSSPKLMRTVIVSPPFWTTSWFIIFVSLTGLIMITGSIRLVVKQRYEKVIRKMEEEKRLIEEQIKLRDNIARDLHDDLSATVSSLSFYIHALENLLPTQAVDAKSFLKKTKEIIGRAQQSMSDIVWSVNPVNDTIEETVEHIRLFAADITKAAGIEFQFQLQLQGHNKITQEQRKNIYFIAKEAINNSVKYSGSPLLFISFTSDQNGIEMCIKDNGAGFNSSDFNRNMSGNGLRNIQSRSRDIGAHCRIQTEPGKGTFIFFSLSFAR